jgi:hypothetical protein
MRSELSAWLHVNTEGAISVLEKAALVQEIYVQPYARYSAVRDNEPHIGASDSATRCTTSTWTDGVEEDQDLVFTCVLVFMWM